MSRKGSAIIEAALVLAILGPLLFTATRLAYGAYQLHTLETAVAEAARFASGNADDPALIRNVAAYGNPEGSGAPRLAGLRPDQFDVTVEEEEGWPARVRVSVRSARARAFGGIQILNGQPSAEFPYTGQAEAAASSK